MNFLLNLFSLEVDDPKSVDFCLELFIGDNLLPGNEVVKNVLKKLVLFGVLFEHY